MYDPSNDDSEPESLSASLSREIDRILRDAPTTADLWQTLQRMGSPPKENPTMGGVLRNAVRSELARREDEDATRIHSLVEDALTSGDLRPFWAAKAAYATTSPDLTARIFSHEPDDADGGLRMDPAVPAEEYESARRLIRAQIAAIEETTPTGSMIEAFSVLEDAIAREDESRREPLRYALELERRRQARTARNLLRTRLALSLSPGRSYDYFLSNRVAFADLSEEDRRTLFGRTPSNP